MISLSQPDNNSYEFPREPTYTLHLGIVISILSLIQLFKTTALQQIWNFDFSINSG